MIDLAYGPGAWFAAVLDDAVVALPPTSDADTASRIYDAAQRDTSADGLIQLLSRQLGVFGPLPPFAVLVRGADGTRVLLRGPVEVVVGAERVSGRGADRWIERSFPLEAAVELSLDGRATSYRLPVAHGVVQCGWLGPRRRPRLHAGAPDGERPARVPPPPPVAEAVATVPSRVVPSVRAEPVAGPEAVHAPPAATDRPAPDRGERPGDHDGLTLPAEAATGGPGAPAPVMEVSTGLRVELGPSTVVGRRPSAALGGVPPDARMVTVPSPGHDVSRNHLEVRVDGGRVTARDLGSTNGTRLRRSGGTVQLVAGQAHPLREGDVALLGDGVELRFTGLP